MSKWILLFGLTVGIVLLFALVGCSEALPGLEPTATPTVPPTETPEPTSTPTLTPTPLPPVGVLLIPEGSNAQLAEKLQANLSQWIPEQGMRFQVRPTLTNADFERDEFLWIIAIPPFDDLAVLARSQPQARFLAVGFNDLDPGENLTVIAHPDDGHLQQAFLAGYMAMVITPDWRAGMLRVNTEQGEQAAAAFFSGSLFFCSSPSAPGQEMFCRPVYAPIIQYPVIVYGEPEVTAPDEWMGVGRFLINNFVETVFISPEIPSDHNQIIRYMAGEGANLIGGTTPPEGVSENWVASLTFDLYETFTEVWPQFAAGEPGDRINVPLSLTNVNPDLLSPGRQQFVEEMLVRVQSGYVDYGVEYP